MRLRFKWRIVRFGQRPIVIVKFPAALAAVNVAVQC